MSDAESLVVALRDYFNDNWNDKVDQLNDGYKAAASPVDPIRLRHVQQIFTAERQRTSIQQFPVLYILSNDSRNLRWGSTFENWSHTVEIGVIEQDQEADTLDTMVKRYLEDVVWILLKAGHFAGSIGGYQLAVSEEAGVADIAIDWGPTVPGGSGNMTQDAKLTLRMEG